MPINEKDIQLHIWKLQEKWVNLIKPVTFPSPKYFTEGKYDIYALNPQDALLNLIYKRLSELEGYIRESELIGCEVHLKKDSDSTIRADLLCSSTGRGGFGIIEIKKSAQTERQSYTELLGYGNHIQSLFPGMSTEDLFYVLIAPLEERIVREATLLNLLNDEKPVFCLIPKWTNDDIKTLELHPWIPNEQDLVQVSNAMFHPSNIDIFKLTWDYVEDWNYLPPEKNPEPYMVTTINKLSIYASQIMEAKHINGFVFASQPWAEMPLHPNSLIIGGINPYKVAQFLHKIRKNESNMYNSETIDCGNVKLADILPEIINSHTIVNNDYMEELSSSWINTIMRIARQTFETMTLNSQKDTFSTDHSSMTWQEYQKLPFEDIFVHNYDIRPTGILRNIFQEYQNIDYQYLTNFGYGDHPFHSHGDIPQYSIDNWYNISYFREFLERLYDPLAPFRFDLNDDGSD